jgi:hypothetical protein
MLQHEFINLYGDTGSVNGQSMGTLLTLSCWWWGMSGDSEGTKQAHGRSL